MSIEAVKLCGVKEKRIYKSISKLKNVSGRLELAKMYRNNIKVFVDYAHTPDALMKTLISLQKNYGKKFLVFLVVAEIEIKKKRPLMAKIANKFCQKVYITDDNPRSESPKKIRDELLKYIFKYKALDIGNRTLAIKKAIQKAEPNEIVLVAGKGHEKTNL